MVEVGGIPLPNELRFTGQRLKKRQNWLWSVIDVVIEALKNGLIMERLGSQKSSWYSFSLFAHDPRKRTGIEAVFRIQAPGRYLAEL